MDQPSSKTDSADRRETKPANGVFAVICSATGETWVSQSHNLDHGQMRLWGSLRQANGPHPSLQASWDTHGPEAFRYEELERLRDDFPPLDRTTELKRRMAIWRARLHAVEL